MTKSIHSLITDIQNLLKSGKDISDEDATNFGISLSKTIQDRLKPREVKSRGTLRMSNLGKPDRQLWYEVNKPEKAEEFHPNTYLKFMLGDIVEDVLLFLVEQSGHSVKARQHEIEIDGIKGHIDAIIDGVLVDTKSASPFSFKKFESGLKEHEDPFGYTFQIQGYIEGTGDHEDVTDNTKGAFLVLQKVTGDITLDIHHKTDKNIPEIIAHKKAMVDTEEPPPRCFLPEPMGKSGNMKLGLECSYCNFKQECHPGLRTFLYANGPVFLTTVIEEPKVPEVKK